MLIARMLDWRTNFRSPVRSVLHPYISAPIGGTVTAEGCIRLPSQHDS
jgi:hypothetical protein